MTTHNGKRVTQRGGAGAGRGDNAHGPSISWERDANGEIDYAATAFKNPNATGTRQNMSNEEQESKGLW